jgi:hypothetical protein
MVTSIEHQKHAELTPTHDTLLCLTRTIQDRVFDLRGNRLVGYFPVFAAQAIPPMEAGCRCACERRLS